MAKKLRLKVRVVMGTMWVRSYKLPCYERNTKRGEGGCMKHEEW